jgi:phosphatidate cytidylyltransferase
MVISGEIVYLFMVIACFAIAILFVYVFSFPKVTIDRIAAIAFSFIYCPVMLSFIYLTRSSEPYGKYLIWLILIGSWGCDTFAYLIGSAFGKRKIFPVLSPNKSLAGCIGGILASGIIGGVYGYFYVMPGLRKMGNDKPYFYLVLAAICLIAGLIGMLGDLVASGIKRNKGFKDYAKLIPGHGGIMDRFDSMISTAPAVYVLSLLLILNHF